MITIYVHRTVILKLTLHGIVSYSYNVRGWLTGISGKGYSEDIYYNSGNGTPLYNGNISSVIWRDSTQTVARGYKFTYDSMNRLTDAVYGEGSSLSENPDRYSERGMTYTKNGALTRLLRYGRRNTDDFGLIDSLTITLDGNRVHSVNDGAGNLVYSNSFDFKHSAPKPYENPFIYRGSTYRYDDNGRLTYDPDKRALFSYDQTGNLKRFDRGSVIEYVYSSTGEKLCQFINLLTYAEKPTIFGTDTGPVITTGALPGPKPSNITSHLIYGQDVKLSHQHCTDFTGPFIIYYGKLDKFLFDGGYCTFKDGEASFHYYQQDHLGNNRAVVSEDGTVEQTMEYYPFGGIYGDVSTNSGLQPYKYNGKEFDHSLGLDLYDYGARLYDPALVVWTGVDPLADEYGGISPYVYCGDNPVNAIDPDGKEIRIAWNLRKGKNIIQRYFVYKGGKLYYANGQLYTGKIEYVRKVQDSLNKLTKDDFQLAYRVKELENSKEIHTIAIGDSKINGNSNIPLSSYKDKNHLPTGSNTSYDPDAYHAINGIKRSPEVGLAHELLGHAYNTDKGTTDYSVTPTGVARYEVQAVNIENVALAANKEPKRTKYGEAKIPQKELWNTHK